MGLPYLSLKLVFTTVGIEIDDALENTIESSTPEYRFLRERGVYALRPTFRLHMAQIVRSTVSIRSKPKMRSAMV